LRGALPPVDLRAVCLVRAIAANCLMEVVDESGDALLCGVLVGWSGCVMQEGKLGRGEGGGRAFNTRGCLLILGRLI
jgi:hypothetical protein